MQPRLRSRGKRWWYEAGGLGIVGTLFASAVASDPLGKTVTDHAVNYAASFDQSSAGPGATDMSNHISSLAAQCPGTQFVVGGYSQGASVTDIALGIRTVLGTGTAIPAADASRVDAVVVFGNPLKLSGQTIAAASPAYGPKAGAGLWLLALVSVGIYLVVALVFPLVRRRLPWTTTGTAALRIRYPDGQGILRQVLNEITRRGFIIEDLATEPVSDGGGRLGGDDADGDHPGQVTVTLHVHGRNPAGELVGALSELDYVDAVVASDLDTVDE
jgi:uncharacterized membrane protein YhiD involved in acid resistance